MEIRLVESNSDTSDEYLEWISTPRTYVISEVEM